MPNSVSSRAVRCILLLVVALVLSTPAVSVEPFLKPPLRTELASEEDRLWDESREAATAFRRRGMLVADEAYLARLNEMMTELYPEFSGSIKVRILREVVPNAMAFPNGDVYISLGLLGRLENEAQIAMVLAHEGAHFVQRHGYTGRNNRLVAGTLANVAGLTFGLAGALGGQIIFLGGAAGHGRDMEREADQIGLARIQKLGYGRSDAKRAFEVLRNDAKHNTETKGIYLFASHPLLEERIETVSAGSGANETSRAPTESFVAMHRKLQLNWLAAEIGAGRQKALVAALEDNDRRANMPPEATFYLSEAYRLRADKEDDARAAEWLAKAYALTPSFPPLLRAAGLAAMKEGKAADATTFFKQYLELAPDANDRAFVQSYLSRIEQEGTKQ